MNLRKMKTFSARVFYLSGVFAMLIEPDDLSRRQVGQGREPIPADWTVSFRGPEMETITWVILLHNYCCS